MKPFITSAALLAALWFTPAVSTAQEQDPAPAPAPAPPAERPQESAVPRREAPTTRTQSEGPRQRAETVAQEPQPATSGAVRRGTAAADGRSGRRAPAGDAAATAASGGEEQGAQRRGASRRPLAEADGRQSARDRAVPRTSAPRDRDRERDRVYVYPDYWSYGRYYDPYYYGGLHLGYLAYSPWGWTPAFYGYPYGYGGSGYGYRASGYDVGALKIKVTPRDAEVYVDGYYAGQVNDFDGFLQSLKLDRGGHRIEVRKDGFETLQFDVHVQPDRTITYRGEMKPMP